MKKTGWHNPVTSRWGYVICFQENWSKISPAQTRKNRILYSNKPLSCAFHLELLSQPQLALLFHIWERHNQLQHPQLTMKLNMYGSVTKVNKRSSFPINCPHKINIPLLACCEPLKICKSLIFPYCENKSVISASVTFFGSIPTKSLCSGSNSTRHVSENDKYWAKINVKIYNRWYKLWEPHTQSFQLSISIFYLQWTWGLI